MQEMGRYRLEGRQRGLLQKEMNARATWRWLV
jgi:hypothetical protein